MKNETPSSQKRQLSLLLPSTPVAARPRRRICPPARAAWWISQMRRVVEEGTDFNAPGVR